ncbi:MAG: bile acid:sodium symporter [Planctomycetaceae bacterium]|nr:bile acid:sodium symporter [Planctomycetaceae bacterium]
MKVFLQRRWFLIALVLMISAGHWLGHIFPTAISQLLEQFFGSQQKSWLVAAILFCMSVTLDGRRFRQALASPAPVLIAVLVNAVLMPLAAPVLMPLQFSPDLAAGLLIAASVPCTLAAASVWTRRAGGNDAVSLLVTLVTNGGCVVFTPFWLQTFASGSVELGLSSMMQKLFLTALVPTAVGQLVRMLPALRAAADSHKTALGVAAQLGVLVIVFTAACDGGRRLAVGADASSAGTAAPTLAALAVVTASCIGLHLAAMSVALGASSLLRLDAADRIAVGFAGSQKTLPIGVLIATDPAMFGDRYPWAVFPMLIFHASQLFIDTAVADRFRSQVSSASSSSDPAVAPAGSAPANGKSGT